MAAKTVIEPMAGHITYYKDGFSDDVCLGMIVGLSKKQVIPFVEHVDACLNSAGLDELLVQSPDAVYASSGKTITQPEADPVPLKTHLLTWKGQFTQETDQGIRNIPQFVLRADSLFRHKETLNAYCDVRHYLMDLESYFQKLERFAIVNREATTQLLDRQKDELAKALPAYASFLKVSPSYLGESKDQVAYVGHLRLDAFHNADIKQVVAARDALMDSWKQETGPLLSLDARSILLHAEVFYTDLVNFFSTGDLGAIRNIKVEVHSDEHYGIFPRA